MTAAWAKSSRSLGSAASPARADERFLRGCRHVVVLGKIGLDRKIRPGTLGERELAREDGEPLIERVVRVAQIRLFGARKALLV